MANGYNIPVAEVLDSLSDMDVKVVATADPQTRETLVTPSPAEAVGRVEELTTRHHAR